MARCLVSLSEATVASAVSLRAAPDESLDSVVCRALGVLAGVPYKSAPQTLAPVTARRSNGGNAGAHSVTLFDNTISLHTKQDLLAAVLSALSRRDTAFLERFAGERGRTRRFVSRSREALYPGSPHLAKYARDIGGGWWLATNFSERDIERAIMKACDVAAVGYGTDVVVNFGNETAPRRLRQRPIPTAESL